MVDRYDWWVVGEQGAVLNYNNPPPPPPPPGPPTGGGTPPPAQTTVAPAPAGSNRTFVATPPHIVVDQPKPGRTTTGKKKRQLLSHTSVKVERGRLIITFVLSARARVRIEPLTAGHLVGAIRSRVLAAGRRRMVVPYQGLQPPAQLRIVARPAKKKK
jgi:hypothetical protein